MLFMQSRLPEQVPQQPSRGMHLSPQTTRPAGQAQRPSGVQT
jgi:hypothetical protein